MAALDSAEAPMPTTCEACGRPLGIGAGKVTRVRRGVVKSLCADCEELVAPPMSALGRGSPPSGVQSVDEMFSATDPQAVTVELPPPTEPGAVPPQTNTESEATPPVTPRRPKPGSPYLRLSLYVALAMLAGVVAGVLILAIAGLAG